MTQLEASRKPGRPRIILTRRQIDDLETLAECGATREEQAAFLRVSPDTLQRRIRDQPGVLAALQRARARLKTSLRQKQIRIALDDTHPAQASMLVWLGKTILGQSEKVTLKIETVNDALRTLKEIWPELNEDDILKQLGEPIEADANVVTDGEEGLSGRSDVRHEDE